MGYTNLADSSNELHYYPWQGTEGLGHVAMFRWDTDTLSWIKLSGDATGISANVTIVNSSLTVDQSTHDNLNANANSQWLDTDTDVTHPLPIQLRSSAGTELGTAAAPLRIDPTGSTTQPISAASLPLPTGAATETTLASILADTASLDSKIPQLVLGSKVAASSLAVSVASDQTPIPASQSGSWSVTAVQSAHNNFNANVNVQQNDTDVGPTNPLGVAALIGATQVDVDSVDSTITYVGYAAAGTSTGTASWRIARITSASGAVSIDWADGNTSYDNEWDNRESLSYS